MSDDYIFADAASAAELTRLRLLESVFDPKTREWLLQGGSLAGKTCLEIGAGAGSIAAWLAAEAGPTGSVTAVDTNVRFLAQLAPSIRVIEADFAAATLPAESFDVVHARYVLIHNANPERILDAMLRALRPGGLLLLEEPDFSKARALVGSDPARRAFANVMRAVSITFGRRGMDHAFGSTLTGLLEERSVRVMVAESDELAQAGGSALAAMMSASTAALRAKYVATGAASDEDIDAYRAFAAEPNSSAIYYATVRVLSRTVASTDSQ